MQLRLSLPQLVIIAVILLTSTSVSPLVLETFGQKSTASDLYETKTLKLSPNIKHLVILIPNEGHESQNPGDISSDQRLIDQPYIPQRATVNPGTMVIWFNGDVDYDHKITVVKLDAFNCPHCQAFAHQHWTHAYVNPSSTARAVPDTLLSHCSRC